MVSYYGGLGPMTNAVLWVEVAIFAIFVGMRLYTRAVILRSMGYDDYLVIFAMILQIVYTAFVSVGTHYGLGQYYADVGDAAAYSEALMYEIFSQIAGLMVIGVGKCAVGVFLLRIVRSRIQIIVIWCFIGGTVFLTLFSSITVLVQCIPVQRTWDRTVPGHCWLDFSKVGLTVGSWYVVADFGFALLPWFIIWGLNMKRKEKITVACGLSLGIFAGICGIVRTVALNGLNASEYIHDTVPMLIWSATESTVTIMCSSIPILRPLYVRIRYGSKGDSSSGRTGGQYHGSSSYGLPMYGNHSRRGHALGSTPGIETAITVTHGNSRSDNNNNTRSHGATVVTYKDRHTTSEESILRDTKVMNNSIASSTDESSSRGPRVFQGIQRTDEVSLSYSTYVKPQP